jgi:hypothetical protein
LPARTVITINHSVSSRGSKFGPSTFGPTGVQMIRSMNGSKTWIAYALLGEAV